jgi:hypothetical protein
MCSRYIIWLAYKQRKTKVNLTEDKSSHSWTASIIWRPINCLKVQDSYNCKIWTSKFKKLNIIHEVEDHTSSQQKFHPCNILFAKYILFGMQGCSIHSIWPAYCNLLNLHQLRNKDYRKVSTVPHYMYIAPHWTSSFTGGRRGDPFYKLFPPPNSNFGQSLALVGIWTVCLVWWLIYGLDNCRIMFQSKITNVWIYIAMAFTCLLWQDLKATEFILWENQAPRFK